VICLNSSFTDCKEIFFCVRDELLYRFAIIGADIADAINYPFNNRRINAGDCGLHRLRKMYLTVRLSGDAHLARALRLHASYYSRFQEIVSQAAQP
jgi:hypothetical protein